MSMLEQLEKISAKIFQQSLKTYKFKEIVAHRYARPRNLIQSLALFPNKGVGFYVNRKGWSSKAYVRITQSVYKSHRFGKLYGIRYFEGKKQWETPKRISGTSNRGIWEYSVGQASNYTTDNGVSYTIQDYKAFMEFRKNWQKQMKPQSVENTGQEILEGKQAQEEEQVQK